MPKALKGRVTALSILAFFCIMSRIDYTVHGTLYQYGLQFSYEWADEYWSTYTGTFIVFSIVVGFMYWLGSRKTVDDMKFSFGLAASVNVLMIGGLADVMFYLLWSGGLPTNDVVWWWIPWNGLMGTWNSSKQIILTTFALTVTSLMWIKLLNKRKHPP